MPFFCAAWLCDFLTSDLQLNSPIMVLLLHEGFCFFPSWRQQRVQQPLQLTESNPPFHSHELHSYPISSFPLSPSIHPGFYQGQLLYKLVCYARSDTPPQVFSREKVNALIAPKPGTGLALPSLPSPSSPLPAFQRPWISSVICICYFRITSVAEDVISKVANISTLIDCKSKRNHNMRTNSN